jgi:hypothetical protein
MTNRKPFLTKKQERNLHRIIKRNLNNLFNEAFKELSPDERLPGQVCSVMENIISQIEYATDEYLKRLESYPDIDREALAKLQQLFRNKHHSHLDSTNDTTGKSTEKDKTDKPTKQDTPRYISFENIL